MEAGFDGYTSILYTIWIYNIQSDSTKTLRESY